MCIDRAQRVCCIVELSWSMAGEWSLFLCWLVFFEPNTISLSVQIRNRKHSTTIVSKRLFDNVIRHLKLDVLSDS